MNWFICLADTWVLFILITASELIISLQKDSAYQCICRFLFQPLYDETQEETNQTRSRSETDLDLMKATN